MSENRAPASCEVYGSLEPCALKFPVCWLQLGIKLYSKETKTISSRLTCRVNQVSLCYSRCLCVTFWCFFSQVFLISSPFSPQSTIQYLHCSPCHTYLATICNQLLRRCCHLSSSPHPALMSLSRLFKYDATPAFVLINFFLFPLLNYFLLSAFQIQTILDPHRMILPSFEQLFFFFSGLAPHPTNGYRHSGPEVAFLRSKESLPHIPAPHPFHLGGNTVIPTFVLV